MRMTRIFLVLMTAWLSMAFLQNDEFYPAGRVKNETSVSVDIGIGNANGSIVLDSLPPGVSMDLPPGATTVSVYRKPDEIVPPNDKTRVVVYLSAGKRILLDHYGQKIELGISPVRKGEAAA